MIGRVGILKQRPLHKLFFALWHIDLFHVQWINPCVVHTGGNGKRCGIEILHLLWIDMMPFCVERKFYGIIESASGVTAHKIWHHILLFAEFL